jgi:hypothetical protein
MRVEPPLGWREAYPWTKLGSVVELLASFMLSNPEQRHS